MPPKKKAATGYKFAKPLPKGIILEDIGRKKWKLGPSIGKGGFGEIYSAKEETAKDEQYPYVIKIEPHANGPLFVEINFYIRHAKAADIETFKKEKGLKTFGMPVYFGSGSIEHGGEKYRFLVMQKFSGDLYKIYTDNNKILPVDTVFKIGIQILDILEYIHQRGYVHADIKAANILLGATKDTQNRQVYLVDFGLTSKYSMDQHFKPNPKKAHDGTIEFLSRDAHQGVQTRRGDLEILAYNLIQWLGCKLPWENNLSDPNVVQNSKELHMGAIPKIIKASFGSKTPPKAMIEFLKYIKSLQFNTEPDYKRIRTIFASGVKESGGSIDSPLEFSNSKVSLKRSRTPLSTNRSKNIKPNNDEINGNETPKAKKRGRPKKELPVTSVESDMEYSDDDEAPKGYITIRKAKNKNTSKGINSAKSTSFQDVRDAVGSEDEQEIEPKKTKYNKQSKKIRSSNSDNSAAVSSKDEEKGEFCNDEEETSNTKKRKTKTTLTVITEKCDSTKTANRDISNEPTSLVKKRNGFRSVARKANKGLDKRKSRSLNDLRIFDGYNDAMKEIALKKKKTGGHKNQKNQPFVENQSDDDMVGFTAEMKAIALKAKAKADKKINPAIPIASTSKASNKKGLVASNSRRLQKKRPVTHGDIVKYSDGSISD